MPKAASRVTKGLFWLSDACAWILLCLALSSAFLYAGAGPLLYAMDHEPVPWAEFAVTLIACLLVAKGAFEHTRRRVGSLWILAPGVIALFSGVYLAAAAYVGFCLLVFWAPRLLAFLESQSQDMEDPIA